MEGLTHSLSGKKYTANIRWNFQEQKLECSNSTLMKEDTLKRRGQRYKL
jgi:hypothetical protein